MRPFVTSSLCLAMTCFQGGEAMANLFHEIGGVRVVHVQNHDVGIVSVHVILEAGAVLDPPGHDGLADLTASMLLRGTAKRSYQRIVDEVNDLGATLEAAGNKEYISLYGDFMPRYRRSYSSVLADVLANPTFPPAEFERERSLVLEDIRNLRNDDAELARHFFGRFLYRGHPMGRPTGGYLSTVSRLTVADCKEFYTRELRKGRLLVGLAGAIDDREVEEFVARVTAGLPGGPRDRTDYPASPALDGIKVLVVDKPDRTQTQVLLGRPGLAWSDPDLFPVLVGNTAFGGTFTSRLMQEIREKRGWSYGAYSTLSVGRQLGSLVVSFHAATKDTVPAIKLTLELLRDLADKGLTEEEVSFARNNLANQFPFRVETARKVADEAMADILFDRPAGFLDTYIEKVRAHDRGAVNRALARWFAPDGLAMVVVATAADVVEDLKAIPGVKSVEVVPYDHDELQTAP